MQVDEVKKLPQEAQVRAYVENNIIVNVVCSESGARENIPKHAK